MGTDTYGLTLVREGDGLRATVTGERNVANTFAYWEGIIEAVRAQKPRWLFVNDLLRGEELDSNEWFALVARVRGQGLEGIRIAHVKPHGINHLEYCEIFAREAGLDARAFHEAGAAQRWLRYGVPDESN